MQRARALGLQRNNDDDSAPEIGGTLIVGLDFVNPSGSSFADCQNIYNMTPIGSAPGNCPACDISGMMQFQSLSLNCPSAWLGSQSGDTVSVGVDISADLLMLNQGSGWANYAGNGNATGNTVTGTYDGSNDEPDLCFDLDGDGYCDPGSDLTSTEQFILSW